LKIYNIEEAKESILKRKALNKMDYSPLIIQRTEALFGKGITPPKVVEMILNTVELDGDQALFKWSREIDEFTGDTFVIPETQLKNAWEKLDPTLQESMDQAASRIRSFHERQPINDWLSEDEDGKLGQRFSPIKRVGVYVPGGTAPLPSSLLMSVIPAQVAGVKEIIIATPPEPASSILAAAYLCGVDHIYQIGGAQAIAALAFGTESVPRVDKIVGAGNLFVSLAKQQLYGLVGLDGLAGPTETMVIADETARADWVAADLLAQAEHDVQASAILLTTDPGLATDVVLEIAQQTDKLSRKEIIKASLENAGGIVIVESLNQAADLANNYGAEHLCLSVAEPEDLMNKINNAGCFFLGDHSFEVLGDYIAGPSHVMPTGGTARFASPLNVLDFLKLSSVIGLNPQGSIRLGRIAADLAELENLTAHAAAAQARLEDG